MARLFDHDGHIIARSTALGVDADLPLAPALILFGPNDCGKTNTLRAIATVLSGEPSVPRDAFREVPPLDHAEDPGSLLLGAYLHERNFDRISINVDLSTETDRTLLYRLVNAGDPISDRLFQPSALDHVVVDVNQSGGPAKTFSDFSEAVSKLQARVSRTESEQIEAVYASLVDSLCEALGDGENPETREAMEVWLSACTIDLGSHVAGLYVLDIEDDDEDEEPTGEPSQMHCVAALPSRLLAHYVDLVVPAHFEESARTVLRSLEPIILKENGWERAGAGEEWFSAREESTTRLDPWFDEDSGLPSTDVVEICRRVSESATRIAPGFVTEQYRIELQALEPSWWHLNEGERLRAALVPRDGSGTTDSAGEPPGFGLEAVGAGLRVWSTFAIVEALRRMSRSGERETLFLFDEPERHLHPVAQREAAAFIGEIVREGANVIVATHAPGFLNEPIPHARWIRLSRVEGQTRAYPLDSGRMTSVERNLRQLGLTPADLIQLARGVLLVEGVQDRLIIGGFFGDQLADAQVRILSLRGTHNALALVDAELLKQLGIPVFLMLDRTSSSFVDQLNRGLLKPGGTDEEKVLAELAYALSRENFSVTPIPLDVPDIVWTLPEKAVKLVAPTFPGWEQATQELLQHDVPINAKKLLRDRYDLNVASALESLIAVTKEHGLEPSAELRGAMSLLLQYLEDAQAHSN